MAGISGLPTQWRVLGESSSINGFVSGPISRLQAKQIRLMPDGARQTILLGRHAQSCSACMLIGACLPVPGDGAGQEAV